MNNNFQTRITNFFGKINSNLYIQSLMTGMIMLLPLILTGALCSLIKVFPIPIWIKFLSSTGIGNLLELPLTFTNNMMGLLISFSVAYSLSEHFKVAPAPTALTSMVSFLVLSPVKTVLDKSSSLSNTILPFEFMGAQGMFTGILVAFIFGRLFIQIVLKGWTIKMPDSVPPYISKSFQSIVPAFIIISLAVIVNGIMRLTPFGNIHRLIYGILQVPLQHLGGSIWSLMIVMFVAQVLWFFGIHGSMVTMAIVMPVWYALDAAQMNAFNAGASLPHITGYCFFTTYGQAGNLIPIAFMLAFLAKSSQYKTLGRLAFAPSLFTIGEPLAYGVPLVMNFVYLIPYVTIDAVLLGLAYVLTSLGILPRVNGIIFPAGTPFIISGFMAGSWKIALFQVVEFFIRFAAWFPFFKIADNQLYEKEQASSNGD